MTERMSAERLAEIERLWASNEPKAICALVTELLAALKAEREAAKLSHDMFIGAMADIKSMEREIEAAEARIKELEASALTGYEDGWHALRNERDGLKSRLEALRGLPNKWRKGIVTYGHDGSRSEGPMRGNDCAAELEALLK